MKVIASYNLKGGVGKTTAAVNLAYLSARQGRRTLLWDLDPQGAATYLFRVKPRVKGGSPKLVRGSRPMLEAIKATDFAQLDLLPADHVAGVAESLPPFTAWLVAVRAGLPVVRNC